MWCRGDLTCGWTLAETPSRNEPPSPSFHLAKTLAISFCISAAIGIFFGYYPALQASKVEPITALRFE